MFFCTPPIFYCNIIIIRSDQMISAQEKGNGYSTRHVQTDSHPVNPRVKGDTTNNSQYTPARSAARLSLMFSFPCSADHERDWPPCTVLYLVLQ